MFRISQDLRRHDRRAVRFAICGALAMGLVACAGSGPLAKVSSASQSKASVSATKLNRAVAAAEQGVARSPRDAGQRVALGNAYLEAGRFASAATTFEDALALGDTSPSTALRLSLAHIGAGHNTAAVAVLDEHRDAIPASDLGLALALAGETSRGVALLTDAVRGGDDNAKSRQNLAYALALDGRWAEARVMASQDVPADQINDRIGEWAMTGRPEDFQKRVAALLGTPLAHDEGQPAELALADRPAMPAAPQMAMAPSPNGELPPSDPSHEFVQPAEPQAPAFAAAPEPAPLPAAAPAAPAANFAAAFSEPAPAARSFSVPAKAHAVKPVAGKAMLASSQPVAGKPQRAGTHRIQLGAFSNPDNARRAVKTFRSRNPQLRNYELSVTQAVVGGKNFWRVAATGFDQRSAVGMCSTVREHGGACFAYATLRALPGTVPARGNGGPAMARR